MAVEPRDIMRGTMYWHQLTYEHGVKLLHLVERAYTQEIDPPFRYGSGISIRLPFSNKAVVIGHWTSVRPDESSALTYAIRGRYIPEQEVDWNFIREFDGAKNAKAEFEAGH